MRQNNLKTVSVVIPTFNEEKYIENCIKSLIDGTSENVSLEIIVVDGHSNDKTLEIVSHLKEKYGNIFIEVNDKVQTQYALNIGVRKASSEYVLIAGAHTIYPPKYIETLLYYLENLQADGVGGQLKTDVLKKTKISQAIVRVLSHPLGVGNSLFRTGVKKPTQVDTVPYGLYKKSLFEKVGYYNEKLVRNHDMEWSKRVINAGHKIYLIPDVSCVYFARDNLKDFARNAYNNGLWNILAVYITKTFKSLSIRHFVPFLFVTGLLLSLLLGFFSTFFWGIFMFILSSYILSILAVSLFIDKKGTTLFHLILVFITLHFFYGLGSIMAIVKILNK